MARHRQSLIEDLIDLAALLPAWVSLLCAVIFYFLLHRYSLMEIPGASPVDVPKLLHASLAKQGATAGQYLVPMIFGLVPFYRSSNGASERN